MIAPAGWALDHEGWIWRNVRPKDGTAAPRDGFIAEGKVFCKFAKDARAFDAKTIAFDCCKACFDEIACERNRLCAITFRPNEDKA